MKTCPVCSARCFDDMEVCYGCLHTFADQQVGGCANVGDNVEGEADCNEFESFEPEPVSDEVARQAMERSKSHEQLEPSAAIENMRMRSFDVRVDIDRTEGETVKASIRIPADALRVMQIV